MCLEYVKRGKGNNKTSVDRHTKCRDCESLNNSAYHQEKAGWPDAAVKNQFVEVFSRVPGALPLIALRLLDKPVPATSRSRRRGAVERMKEIFDGLESTASLTILRRLRIRDYKNADEAYEDFKANESMFTDVQAVTAKELIEAWFDEEDNCDDGEPYDGN